MTKSLSKSLLIAACFGLLAPACATAPDPAKVCTAEWITPRANKAMKRIETRAGKSIKALKKASESWAKGKKPGLLTMMSLEGSIKSLEKELTEGKGITDLRMLAKTCDDPQIITKSVRAMFERQQISPMILDFLENSSIFDRILGDAVDARGTKA